MERVSSSLSERKVQFLQSICDPGRDMGILAYDTLVCGFGLYGDRDDPLYTVQCHCNDGTLLYNELFHGEK